MKSVVLFTTAALVASCASDPGHFHGAEGKRRSSGNAPLEGPSAGDVIHDVHRDRVRQNYEDRTSKRRYGRYD